MLKLEHLRYRREGFALEADFTLDSGAICAVIGPSGSGKSTLINLIAGFEMPDRGRILWNGHDLVPLAPGARPVSILFQDNNLFPHLDAWANVALGLSPSLRLNADQKADIAEAFRLVGLQGLEHRRPAELSGGQQGRVALARALVRDRPILLLDEPFAALGPALRAEMLDLVRDLNARKGITVLMVSHDPADALRIAPLTIFIEAGHVEPPSDTQKLFAAPPPALRRYLGPS